MVVGDFPIEVDTLVIGSGPGGYVAAIRAAQKGQKVTVVEKDNLGGVCLNVGCVPSKALIEAGHRYHNAGNSDDMGISVEKVNLDFSKVQEWKESVVQKLTGGVQGLLKGNGVEVVRGEAFFVDDTTLRVMDEKSSQTYKFENCIVATGSQPVELPKFKFSDKVVSSTGALQLKEVPEKMVVIGGGYIGVELGAAYANLGSEVTILEGLKNILPGFEKQMSQLVVKRLKNNGVTIKTEAFAQEMEETENGVKIKAEINGEIEEFESDVLLVTVGRKPNTDELGLEQAGVEVGDNGLVQIDKQCRTSVKNIYAIGDIVEGPALAHKASYEAKVAAEAIAGEPSEIDYTAIPEVVFSGPELAQVGLTEQQAKDEGYEVEASKFPFAANGRALSLNEEEGFMKMVTRKEDGLVLGVQIAGHNASDMISEACVAIEAGMTAEDIALTIHAHPSLGEITMETAELATGLPIHVVK
ncbi:dihydrolipoyl dehydrogenase [Salisediminibacterium halotolerans]|uniref:Dihydrolipoyl dehydrogenase n=1 Tax=Salisediminibacterium halotolerans TaxID=517425 RepID=A0A1H9WM89_9BACI|nr:MULTISPECIES: dihydrolipoyl dehydrogenase [Salisediminibacterium]RLJ74359.1 dihydrolipoamide dehydrogenase [Actinophytocola xinjiangensis]RPE87548.1 dihydrolipoamide dehydrogenase [Salisediminibacterium halotolerans]TWG35196.1 dihydrolipoamide dehydrogenase [Salisediminibacterium halotolerans]SES35032.1 dihydrolipoamide dehydrogenase [Salisediminibacterium haloalkalitolerans]GEL08172.1 dihydrolipoyl dehydrogenase [Salisediminibacterium halotolerans]